MATITESGTESGVATLQRMQREFTDYRSVLTAEAEAAAQRLQARRLRLSAIDAALERVRQQLKVN